MMVAVSKEMLLLMKKKLLLLKKKKAMTTPSNSRRLWVHPINRGRKAFEIYHTLVAELREEHAESRHKQYFRMKKDSFDHLLTLIGPSITKQDTNMREAIEPGPERL